MRKMFKLTKKIHVSCWMKGHYFMFPLYSFQSESTYTHWFCVGIHWWTYFGCNQYILMKYLHSLDKYITNVFGKHNYLKLRRLNDMHMYGVLPCPCIKFEKILSRCGCVTAPDRKSKTAAWLGQLGSDHQIIRICMPWSIVPVSTNQAHQNQMWTECASVFHKSFTKLWCLSQY